jgi:2-keto-4-pentenoate hydratase/2-oxohepta-3-ene-1,7-dioic acid hydratase in catechol pathway
VRLLRVGEPGRERPCLLAPDGRTIDVAEEVGDYDAAFFAGDGLARLAALAERLDTTAAAAPPPGGRVGPPLARPGKIVCIGLNYADHARESGAALPAEPVVFAKAANTVVGPYDDVLIPIGSEKTDWEVELGVVIGRTARYLPDPDAARDVIAGYTISNDVSERAFQLERGGQWFKGKSCETFNPLGPWLVTPDEIGDPQGLGLWLEVNRRRVQDSSTAEMVFGVYELVHYLSQFLVLEPGDLVNTGTPAGVGLGMDPPCYLRPGDVMELGIDGLGTQRQTCRQAT